MREWTELEWKVEPQYEPHDDGPRYVGLKRTGQTRVALTGLVSNAFANELEAVVMKYTRQFEIERLREELEVLCKRRGEHEGAAAKYRDKIDTLKSQLEELQRPQ